METARRTLVKAITWQAIGLITMTVIGMLATGSFSAGGTLAIVTTTTGLLFYMIHERIWARISWGRRDATLHRPGAARFD